MKNMSQEFTEQELKEIKIMLDPVLWGETFLRDPMNPNKEFKLRWYQKEILRSKKRKKVVRAGRRIGKSHHEDTLVMTPNGHVKIKNIKEGDIVYAYDVATDSIHETPVVALLDKGICDVVDLQRRGKTELQCTPEHRWHTITERGYKKVRKTKELYKGCNITRRFVDIPMGDIDYEEAYTLGALLGDGCSTESKSNIIISSENDLIPKKVKEILDAKYLRKSKGNNYSWVITNNKYRKRDNILTFDLYEKWCKGKKAHEKIVDINIIKTWNRKSCLKFLAGLIDTDGSVQVVDDKELFISFDTQSKSIRNVVVFLYKALFQKEPTVIIDNRDKYVNGKVYSVRIKNNLHCKRILKQLSPYIQTERKRWKDKYENLRENNENANFLGYKIVDNKKQARCFDISIGTKDHLYLLANGTVTHNSVTLIVEILWKLYTKQYRRLVLITPYKSQIQELWEIMNNMIENSPKIKNSIKRQVNNPHQLELYNGSQLKCFTAGSKSSSKGANIRSISAHDIYLDEADYLGESALAAIEPLLLTDKDTTLWASSTPTGRRERFYRWVNNATELGFEAFYYPSSISPNWVSIAEVKKKGLPLTQSDEYYFRSTNPESVYVHEYDANFGDEEEGVFKSLFIDENVYDFQEDFENANLNIYNPKYKINPKNTYIMGIDWNNSSNGTQIVITEYLNQPTKINYYIEDEEKDGLKIKKTAKLKDKFRLFYRASFSLGEDTQLYSVRKIIELLNLYKIDHIYCDSGFGTTNIELLREHGIKNKHLGLDKKLIPIDFGSRINVLDPLTKKVEKKPMKPFIVYTAVNEIEKGNCILPFVEDDEGRLIGQMRAYSIKKHSQAGMPVFSQGNEHILIAWLLSIVGFHMEYSTLIKPEIDPNDLHIGRIIKPSKLMPFLGKNTERKTIKDNNNKMSFLFSVDEPKPMIPGNKITTDPRFYYDGESKSSYKKNVGSSPWNKQSTRINNFNPHKGTQRRGSPSGRKLI